LECAIDPAKFKVINCEYERWTTCNTQVTLHGPCQIFIPWKGEGGVTEARKRELYSYHSEAVWHRVPTAPGTVVTKMHRFTELIQRHRTTVTQI
jgi:hypothetical protein